MPSFPIRPTFPIDVRSPSGTVRIGRQGTSLTFEIDPASVASNLAPSLGQFFGALEALSPGASATIQSAIPSDPTDPINRAYRQTSFMTPGCTLLTFVATTLGLTSAQVTNLLAQAALQPK